MTYFCGPRRRCRRATETKFVIYYISMKAIKSLVLALAVLAAVVPARAQSDHVSWSTEVNTLDEGVYQIVFTATLDAGWHIYDLGPYEVGGPMATTFEFAAGEGYELDGGVYALTDPVREFNDIYEMEIGYYDGKAEAEQELALLTA